MRTRTIPKATSVHLAKPRIASRRMPRHRLFLVCLLVAGVAPLSAQGQAAPVPGSPLVTLTQNNPLFSDVERAAAFAGQSLYSALAPGCVNGPGPGCTSLQFNSFAGARALVENAFEITTGSASQPNSLRLTQQGLAGALRFVNAEEISANSRIATDFANGQVANATSRITALRYGATGFSIAGFPGMPAPGTPGLATAARLGPAGDGDADALSKWGGFLNGAYGWGTQDPTRNENAFDYDSVEITGGIDYRVLPSLVVGLLGGYSGGDVDFDPGKSAADGRIDSDGFSVGTFGLYSWKDVYLSGFFSYQRMDIDIDRVIGFVSQNPGVPSFGTTARGDTHSDAYTFAANLGYTHRFGFWDSGYFSGKPFLLEPSLRLDYTVGEIDGYSEKDANPNLPFALRIDDQDFDSLELALGLRGSVALSTPFGVVFPYSRFEWRFELRDDPRATSATFRANPAPGLVPFRIQSGDIDDNYGSVAVGLQTTLLGGQQRALGGPLGGRLSVFAEYRTVFQLDDIDSELVNGGIRYSF